MAGLSQYTVNLTGGVPRAINARGNMVFIRTANSEVVVDAASLEIGDRGTRYRLEMFQGEKLFTASEYDQVVLQSDAAQTVQVILGYGDFVRQQPLRAGIAANIRNGEIELTDGTRTLIAAENLQRKRIKIRVHADEADAYLLLLPDTSADAGGVRLYDGEYEYIEATGDIYGEAVNVSSSMIVTYREEQYSV